MSTDSLGPQFMPAHQIRSEYRPSPHELYSENTGKPWFHEDDHENLRLHREAKLQEAQKGYYTDEPAGPDNPSLVDHIKRHGFVNTVLLDSRWKHVVDGNHHLEAAHHIDPNFPVPVSFKR